MKIMRYLILPVLALLSLSTDSFARDNGYRGKQYYLRHSIIYLGSDLPKVFPDRIIFTPACICSFSSEVYPGKILSRGTPLEVADINEQGDWAKVRFTSENQTHEILLKNDSKKNFGKAFNLIFSEKKAPEPDYDNPKTKKDLIKSFGFPISMCKDGVRERWFYIIEFVGFSPYGSFDGFCIEIKGDKVVTISGYI